MTELADVAAGEVSPELFAYLATDPVADLLGIVFERIAPGFARARMPVTHRLLNAPGTAHGGAMMALVDVVHAAVSNSHGVLAVAQEVHTEFLAAGAEGDVLICEGVELSRTRRTAVYRIDVRASGRPGTAGAAGATGAAGAAGAAAAAGTLASPDHPDGPLLATALARVFRIGTPLLPEEAAR